MEEDTGTAFWHSCHRLLKGEVTRCIFALKAYQIKSVLSVHAQKVFNFSGCLVKKKITIKSLLASLKIVNNSKGCYEAASEFLFRLFFTVIGQLFPVYMS
jgi:hypothetical protein